MNRLAGLYAETTDVPMDLIKQLRGMSGAPIMDCKKALAVSEALLHGARQRKEGAKLDLTMLDC